MCGIVGIWTKEPSPDRREFDQLLSTLLHRGPDALWFSSLHNLRYGSTRLAIVDTAVQLADDSNGESTDILLNGEIWNYRELAQQFAVPEPVTERKVIRTLYEKLGNEFVCHLEGMFALVVVDKLREEFHIYRDPVGIKPLFYWTDSSKAFIFSSDAKTICQWREFSPQINERFVINEYVFGFSDYQENLFEGIRQIRPRSSLTVSIGGNELKAVGSDYIPVGLNRRPTTWSEQGQLDAIQNAVYRQYRHCEHLPIGLLLSGGIDSSLLLFIAKTLGLRDVVCFYCGSEGSADHFWAYQVATQAGYEIRSFTLSASEVWEDLASSCYSMSGTNSLLPHMCRKIRAMFPGIRVLWSGEGADELFGGYPCHGGSTELLELWKRRIAETKRRTSLMDRVEQIWVRKRDEFDRRIEVCRLYKGEQLVNAHLVPHDYGGMAVSIEIRLPFLDLCNVEMCECIPAALVLGSLRKPVLKSLLRRVSGISEDNFYEREKLGLLHGYLKAIHELRKMAQLLERNDNQRGPQREFLKGPYQRVWYGLVQKVFVGERGRFANISEAAKEQMGAK